MGKKIYELTMKQRMREIDIIPIPEVQSYHEAKSIQNPTIPNLTLQCFDQFSILSNRHDTPINMKVPANSPYYSAKKQRYTSENKAYFQQKDGSTTDMRTNIRRNKLTKKLTYI